MWMGGEDGVREEGIKRRGKTMVVIPRKKGNGWWEIYGK